MRFDYVKYDENTQAIQDRLKTLFVTLEEVIEAQLPNCREKSLTLTKLEETYMWAGKALKAKQLGELTIG